MNKLRLGEYVSALSIATALMGKNLPISVGDFPIKNLSWSKRISINTKAELVVLIGISDTAIDNNIRNNGYIKRIGENQNGYWEVIK